MIQFLLSKFKSVKNWTKGGFWEFIKPIILQKIFKLTNVQDENSAIEKINKDESLTKKLDEYLFLIEEIRCAYLDRQNARDRDLKLKFLYGSNYRGEILVVLCFIFIICGILLIFFSSSESIRSISTILIGFFTACLQKVYSFEFGTAGISKKKTFKENVNFEKFNSYL